MHSVKRTGRGEHLGPQAALIRPLRFQAGGRAPLRCHDASGGGIWLVCIALTTMVDWAAVREHKPVLLHRLVEPQRLEWSLRWTMALTSLT